MAEIQSGSNPSTKADVGDTSKGLAIEPRDSAGVYRGAKASFSAGSTATFAAAAGSAMFAVIQASVTKTIRLQRIIASGFTLTSVAYQDIICEKWSTAPTGGTATVLVQTPHDGVTAGTAALCQVYTVAPTEGTLVGTIGARRVLLQATTAAAAGLVTAVEWDWRYHGGEPQGPRLRVNTGDCVSIAFGGSPASAVSLAVEFFWTEE